MQQQIKIKIGVFAYYPELDDEIEYFKEYNTILTTVVEFSDFMRILHENGTIKHLNAMFGTVSNTTTINKHNTIEELYIFDTMSEDRFNELCSKWEAIFAQQKILKHTG